MTGSERGGKSEEAEEARLGQTSGGLVSHFK